MFDKYITAITTILLAILGLATIALLLSPQAQTPNVLQAIATQLSCAIQTAISPIVGSSTISGCQSSSVTSVFNPL
jgi:PRD1 phage membrane DNA delivery